MTNVAAIDRLVADSLQEFARDVLGCGWLGKEHDWVNRYAHGYLIRRIGRAGPIQDPGQFGIEVAVPQPPGYKARAVRRDLVIWPRAGSSCWSAEWTPTHHPLAILEWKVHRPGHRNPAVRHEREWLRNYSAWQKQTVAYAVEVDTSKSPAFLRCSRFKAGTETPAWRHFVGRSRG